jgi:DNA-directed RNA polymerase alpha subunit
MKDSAGVTPLTRAEQWEKFAEMTRRARAKRKKEEDELLPFVQQIERDEDNVTFYVTCTESLSRDKWDSVVSGILAEYRDIYIAHAQKTSTNKLLVRLKRPRRDVDPDSRRLVRCFVGLIASKAFVANQ